MSSNVTSPPPRKPHVLMLPFPLQGHITPLMQLSKLLAARGFDITFVTTKFYVNKMLHAKQSLMVRDLTRLGIRLVGISDGLPDTDPHTDLAQFVPSLHAQQIAFGELVGRMVQEQGLHITCIISDSFMLGSQDVANKWRIPRVSFWPQSLTAFACSISLPKIMAAYPNLDPFKDEVYRSEGCRRVMNCIPGLCHIDTCHLPFFAPGDGAEWLHHHVRVQMERVKEPVCIICNSFPSLERDVLTHLREPLLPKPILTLGPLLPSAFLAGQNDRDDNGTGSSLFDEDQECLQWLDGQVPHSVLYISLGSLAILEERDVIEITMGLEACKVPFLWVLRSHPSTLNLANIQKTDGKIIEWAPQLRVLSHEAVGGFFSHCGWNSTIESVSLGVPVIGWPQVMDQITNCWLQVEKLKAGLRLELDNSHKIGHVGVENAVRTLMLEEEGHQMRARASNISVLAQNAFTTSLPSNLDSLVHTILSSSEPSCPLA